MLRPYASGIAALEQQDPVDVVRHHDESVQLDCPKREGRARQQAMAIRPAGVRVMHPSRTEPRIGACL